MAENIRFVRISCVASELKKTVSLQDPLISHPSHKLYAE